jgi:hypothetical protein
MTAGNFSSFVYWTILVFPLLQFVGQTAAAINCPSSPGYFEQSSDDEETIKHKDDLKDLSFYSHQPVGRSFEQADDADVEEDEDAEERERQLEEARLTR